MATENSGKIGESFRTFRYFPTLTENANARHHWLSCHLSDFQTHTVLQNSNGNRTSIAVVYMVE